jgi:hypothetical protein
VAFCTDLPYAFLTVLISCCCSLARPEDRAMLESDPSAEVGRLWRGSIPLVNGYGHCDRNSVTDE